METTQTDHLHRIKELTELNAKLEDFTHIIAHDLQGPFNKINSFVSLLRSELGSGISARAELFLHHIEIAAQKGSSLIKGLLTYSKSTNRAEGMEWVDMNKIFSDVLEDLTVEIQQTHAEIKKEAFLSTIFVRSLHMRQLLGNLISNSIKYSQETPAIRITAKRNENKWEFCIKDNGIGIHPKNFERIFDLFNRGPLENKDGAGVGLAICRKIVDAHGGKIWVESIPGEGSTFHFTLPL